MNLLLKFILPRSTSTAFLLVEFSGTIIIGAANLTFNNTLVEFSYAFCTLARAASAACDEASIIASWADWKLFKNSCKKQIFYFILFCFCDEAIFIFNPKPIQILNKQ